MNNMKLAARSFPSLVPGEYRLLHGGDYNPEQWQHREEILAADPELMHRARINQASVAIFGWAALEPEPGRYAFAWLDRALDRLHAAGVGVLLATPTAARPRWLAEGHPDVMRTRRDGTRVAPGVGRHNPCWSSPELARHADALIERMAERYARHPALLGWHINNEFGGDDDAARCYCARCVTVFQRWLRVRYEGSLVALNQAWWTSFWSHQYQDWNQIRPGDGSLEALELNWRRFCSHQVVTCAAREIAAVRRYSQAPVTTNFHGHLQHYDHGFLAELLDYTAYDSYPTVLGIPDDTNQAHYQAWVVDAVRSFKPGRPWLLLESCPSQPQWIPSMRLKRPGVHRCLSLAMVAQGSDGVCYFQWRAGRGGMEKNHGAVLLQDGPTDTRVFNEVRQLGGELADLAGVAGAAVHAQIALLWDVESEWARQLNSGLGNLPMPGELARAWHRICWESGYGVDVPDARSDLGRYRIIVVPGLFLLRPGLVERLAVAAEAGAQVLVDGLSAWVDCDMSCVVGGRPGPLGPHLGIWAEELDHLRTDESVRATGDGTYLPAEFHVEGWLDRVHVRDAEIIARAVDGFHQDWPVVTRRVQGRGAFWYLAGSLQAEARRTLLSALASDLAVAPALPGLDGSVIAHLRRQPNADWLFLLNPRAEAATVILDARPWQDGRTGVAVAPTLTLAGWDARVLTAPTGGE
jgi:beta-galactosidase